MDNNLPDLTFDTDGNSQDFHALDDSGFAYTFSVRVTATRDNMYLWLADKRGFPLSGALTSLATVRQMVAARVGRSGQHTDETQEEYNQRTNYGAF